MTKAIETAMFSAQDWAVLQSETSNTSMWVMPQGIKSRTVMVLQQWHSIMHSPKE
jgi:hypothetical protein